MIRPTRRLRFKRRQAACNELIFEDLWRLRSRTIAEPHTIINRLRGLMEQLSNLGDDDFQQRVENWFYNPSTALQTLYRIEDQLTVWYNRYPTVTNDLLEQISGVIEAFATSHVFAILPDERFRPSGSVLLSFFHSHPTNSQPSGLAGITGTGGDIGVAVSEGQGSFVITGTPTHPRIFLIAEGRWWEVTASL